MAIYFMCAPPIEHKQQKTFNFHHIFGEQLPLLFPVWFIIDTFVEVENYRVDSRDWGGRYLSSCVEKGDIWIERACPFYLCFVTIFVAAALIYWKDSIFRLICAFQNKLKRSEPRWFTNSDFLSRSDT